jgi:hypothetical protein
MSRIFLPIFRLTTRSPILSILHNQKIINSFQYPLLELFNWALGSWNHCTNILKLLLDLICVTINQHLDRFIIIIIILILHKFIAICSPICYHIIVAFILTSQPFSSNYSSSLIIAYLIHIPSLTLHYCLLIILPIQFINLEPIFLNRSLLRSMNIHN